MTQLDGELEAARSTLSSAQHLSVPSQMARAQQYVLLALTMRRDGIESIANNIQSAMTKSTSKTGIQNIQHGTSSLYGSDIIYKDYAVPAIAGALKNDGLSIGPTTIYGGQVFQTSSGSTNGIATKIGANLPSSAASSSSTRPARTRHCSSHVGCTTWCERDQHRASTPRRLTLSFENGGIFTRTTSAASLDQGSATLVRRRSADHCRLNDELQRDAARAADTRRLPGQATIEKVPGERT